MRVRTRASILAAVAAASLVVAGCGGGGGSASTGSSDPGSPASAGAQASTDGTSTGPTSNLDASVVTPMLGQPDGVDGSRAGEALQDLDQFGTPHDLFRPQVAATSAPATATTTAPTTTTTSPTTTSPTTTGPTTTAPPPTQTLNTLVADFDVNGEPVLAHEGDSIPPDTQQFLVKSIGASSVVLELNGGLLPSGSDTLTLSVGHTLTLRNETARQTYRIRLADITSGG